MLEAFAARLDDAQNRRSLELFETIDADLVFPAVGRVLLIVWKTSQRGGG
jgi:hypothetical protein